MEKLKEALTTLIKVVKTSDEAYSDGKVTLWEWTKIATNSFGLISAVRNFREIQSEWVGSTPEQRTELVEWFKVEFDLRNDNVESMIEEFITTLVSLSHLFNKVK